MKPEYVDDYESRQLSPRNRTIGTSGDQALEDRLKFIAAVEGKRPANLVFEGIARVLHDREHDPEFIEAARQFVASANASLIEFESSNSEVV